MLDTFVRRLPTWLIVAAFVVIAAIVGVQRFVFGQPIYANGVILPSNDVAGINTVASDAREDIERAGRAIAELEKRIEDLERQRTSDLEPIGRRVGLLEQERGAVADTIKGAVLAFDHPDGCPTGWSEFTEGQGRFILGVDGAEYKLPYIGGRPEYQTGGEAQVVLTLAEMPTHTHGVYGRESSRFDDDHDMESLTPNDLYSINRYIENALSEEGGNQPHENMPPYIALYFCKYEGKKNS